MDRKKQAALEAIRQLIAYHSTFLKQGSGYAGDGPLTYITRDKALIALRYGVPIAIRSVDCGHHGSTAGMYDYVRIRNEEMLKRYLEEPRYEGTVSIHNYLPKSIQKKMLGFIDQIIEIESPELAQAPIEKPTAPLLGARGDIYNLMSIAAHTLCHAGLAGEAEQMWNSIVQCGSYFKALGIIGEYVEFGEAPRLLQEQMLENAGLEFGGMEMK